MTERGISSQGERPRVRGVDVSESERGERRSERGEREIESVRGIASECL